MRYLLTSLLCVFTLSLTAQDDCLGPDFNSDGVIGAADLIVFLTYYGYEWPLVPEFVCGETIAHHDYDYSTVQIGEQCWFSENCRYLPVVFPSSEGSHNPPFPNTDPYYYVFDYEGTDVEAAMVTDNYETYGVLYNWYAVMTEGICPSGWHIPSDEEFTELTDFLGGESVAGYAMKSTSGWTNNGNGDDSYGFTGLPGGYSWSGGFLINGSYGVWWSASDTDYDSWNRAVFGAHDYVSRLPVNRNYGFSARCVRD